ncbi:inner centromere protein isoform X1 [Cygnus atratus]|uniref:inner centromere protein isoform X1 n=1 Tax=Cygnus atratus TaxID=8868 RepID=UPI0015D57513|nr:inner centromere protein isoform X1 [Cygnus atratus]XP_035406226.1 inner centromere protein isoform X1 [Cygnus atratus]XP_050566992.1 inner centromere protein isoform X1 [Cygnus atratus]
MAAMTAVPGPAAMTGPEQLPAACGRLLADFLRQVDDTELLWLREIRDEAARMFGSHYSDEPELLPKTPSQKSRQRKKRGSALQGDGGRRRLSRRRTSSLKLVPSKRSSQRLQNKENMDPLSTEVKEASSFSSAQTVSQQLTSSKAAAPAKYSELLPDRLGEGMVPLVEIGRSDRNSAELHIQKSASKPAEKPSASILLSSDAEHPEESSVPQPQPVPAAPELLVPPTPEAKDAGESETVSKGETAKAADTTIVLSEEPRLEEMDVSAHVQEHNEGADKEPSQSVRDSPGTPTGSRQSRRSVRRSLLGKTSMISRTSLAEKYSRARKRESLIRKSIARTVVKSRAPQKLSVSSNGMNGSSSEEVPEDEETVVKTGPPPGPCTPTKLDFEGPRMSLRSRTVNGNEQPQEMNNNESNINKNGETLEPPQSARRKPSYKRAVDQRYDNQQAEDGGLSPPRRKTPSPTCPASKVVRPFKTFLHTVQKNQLLMTPSSVGRNGVIKSFIRHNVPLQTDPKEKERQKLETLRKKQEAEELRKQKVEEERKRRLEEAKLKREERLRKVLQARERAEQMEEERKRRIEQKLALLDEKTEKVREERLAEEKIKKKAAAKKMEEAEARRRQDEEARKQKALLQEEEERRHKELMQKKKEEEQERARKIAEQRQAEQEREKQLAAERELEKRKEQERIQAEKQREQQEKAARLQKEVLAAKEQLQKEVEKKKQEERLLAEMKRQEQEQKKLPEEQKAKDVAQTQHPEKKENSPVCNSYQMTPQFQKDPKPPKINPNNYGMDLNSDDSTDDESQPRKPIPAWASGNQLSQAVIRQYYNPPNVDALFGRIVSPKLEDIFYKSKPRYFKRTSSAVWNSPPFTGPKSVLGLSYSLKKY